MKFSAWRRKDCVHTLFFIWDWKLRCQHALAVCVSPCAQMHPSRHILMLRIMQLITFQTGTCGSLSCCVSRSQAATPDRLPTTRFLFCFFFLFCFEKCLCLEKISAIEKCLQLSGESRHFLKITADRSLLLKSDRGATEEEGTGVSGCWLHTACIQDCQGKKSSFWWSPNMS